MLQHANNADKDSRRRLAFSTGKKLTFQFSDALLYLTIIPTLAVYWKLRPRKRVGIEENSLVSDSFRSLARRNRYVDSDPS